MGQSSFTRAVAVAGLLALVLVTAPWAGEKKAPRWWAAGT
jgi:hypothetical protein